MRIKMQSLWNEVQEAEVAIDSGDAGALDRFILAAGTMIENLRLAKHNFGKDRVSRSSKPGSLADAKGVRRVPIRSKGTTKNVDDQAQAMQDRLERVMGCKSICPTTCAPLMGS